VCSASRGVDLVFVDGEHTHDQALRDIRNSLALLSERGVVVAHDVNPRTPAEAFAAESFAAARAARVPGWTGAWCGDVWKAIVELRRDDVLGVRTLRDGVGATVINPRLECPLLDIERDAIPALEFDDLERHRDQWLGLGNGDEILEWLAGDPAHGSAITRS
jgi:hypothetical protein